jgi:hypothetical protein
MQPVPETIFMQKLTHQHFRLSILTFNPRHIIAAGFLAVHICHNAKIVQFKQAKFYKKGLIIVRLFSTIRPCCISSE